MKAQEKKIAFDQNAQYIPLEKSVKMYDLLPDSPIIHHLCLSFYSRLESKYLYIVIIYFQTPCVWLESIVLILDGSSVHVAHV